MIRLRNYILADKFFLCLFAFSLTIGSCNQSVVDGIVIDHTLYENLSFEKSKELRQLIKRTLNHDEKALSELNKFQCGGAAGCYDLGFVMTQIIYRMGENDFIRMVQKLGKDEVVGLEGLIAAGLEYGDNDKDGKMDNKKSDMEFPKLFKVLTDKYGDNKK